jgi:hypothetical protein
VKNRLTIDVKKAFFDAFGRLGGLEALVAWGRDNPTDFYKLLAKLMPRDVNVSRAMTLQIVEEIVAGPGDGDSHLNGAPSRGAGGVPS